MSHTLAYCQTSSILGTLDAAIAAQIIQFPCNVNNRESFGIQQSDIIFSASPFTFDPSIVDLFLALSTGARLLIVKPSIKAMPSKVRNGRSSGRS